ncbi:Type 1 phosphatases regulator ypi1 [Sporothrix epigloea]|uniref:Type 1 phosphatases regulator ypi1 n=1 Tax=Sporothrix epigloea TaxID=1892477 RepID=A0ABP0DY32_9PEZI
MAVEAPRINASGSQTVTGAGPSTAPLTSEDGQPTAILRLRGAQRSDRSVQWAENVVDNEGLNRKKSKVDESSDSSSSDSDTDSSSSSDSDGGLAARSDADRAFRNRLGKNTRTGKPTSPHRHLPGCNGHGHDTEDDDSHGSGHDSNDDDNEHGKGRRGHGKGKGKEKRNPSPNAYEKMPRYDRPDRPPPL